MRIIYVLWWKYLDGSSADCSRAYASEDEARADAALLSQEGIRQWNVSAVNLFDARVNTQ